MPESIMLDAGHGGERDPGAVYGDRKEKEDVLKLVLMIGEILQNDGIDVEYTRTTDVYESPYEKAMEANYAGVDYFVSIHRNSSPMENQYSGVESLIYDLSGIKLEMAENINQQLETVGFKNLGVKARPNLVVLKRTRMPAVLVEVGFLNTDVDNTLFDANLADIAQAIANGIRGTITDQHKPSGRYQVQVGAFRNQTYAERLAKELEEQGYEVHIDKDARYDRVRVGDYSELSQAVEMERELKKAGYATIIIGIPVSR